MDVVTLLIQAVSGVVGGVGGGQVLGGVVGGGTVGTVASSAVLGLVVPLIGGFFKKKG